MLPSKTPTCISVGCFFNIEMEQTASIKCACLLVHVARNPIISSKRHCNLLITYLLAHLWGNTKRRKKIY